MTDRVYWELPRWLSSKASAWVGRTPGGGYGNPRQYSCLENPMDKGAWWAAVLGLQRVGHD